MTIPTHVDEQVNLIGDMSNLYKRGRVRFIDQFKGNALSIPCKQDEAERI